MKKYIKPVIENEELNYETIMDEVVASQGVGHGNVQDLFGGDSEY